MTVVRVDRKDGTLEEMMLIHYDAANSERPGFPPRSTWVLRRHDGSVVAFDADSGVDVRVRCESCGRVADHVAPSPDDASWWRCHGGLGACEEE